MEDFVKGRNPGDADGQSAALHPGRPSTAQKTRPTQERDGQHNVYETDTEELDDTRSSFSEQASSDGAYDGEGYDQEDHRRMDRFLDLDQSQLDQALWQMRKGQATGHHVNSDPDSYPPTTSGEPEPMEDYEAQDQGGFVFQPAQAYAERPRDAYTTNVPTERRPPTLAVHGQENHLAPSKDDFKSQTKNVLTNRDLSRHKKSQSKAQVTSQSEATHALEQPQSKDQRNTTHKHPSKSTGFAPPAPLEQFERSRRQATQIKLEEAERRHQHPKGATHPQQRANKAEPYNQLVNRDDRPQQRFDRHEQRSDRADQHEQHVDSNDHHEQLEVDSAPEEPREQDLQPEELDYDLVELFTKDLEELQDDPFEGPLREEPDVPPTDFSSKPLEEKLRLARSFEPEKQKRFLASLTIDEWEAAGDWFHNRFSDVFGKLKKARRDRRRLAMEYEQKITERQEAVSKKQKITDEALSEMKVTGAQVLDGTPKKKQKFRG